MTIRLRAFAVALALWLTAALIGTATRVHDHRLSAWRWVLGTFIVVGPIAVALLFVASRGRRWPWTVLALLLGVGTVSTLLSLDWRMLLAVVNGFGLYVLVRNWKTEDSN
jgi:hypothetical protein